MKILLNGYYGYDNAGDEAVLSAILDALDARLPRAEFLVTSGDPGATERLHGAGIRLRALPRQAPRALLSAMRECDVFVSGGGSLLQDATSLRNVVYYVGLMRLSRLCRKPLVIYAQGVGPLRSSKAQRLARWGINGAHIVTVRDDASKTLLHSLGVTRHIEVVADPVFALTHQPPTTDQPPTWCVALRSFPDRDADFGAACESIRFLAKSSGARLLWLPMQEPRDLPLIQPFVSPDDEVLKTSGVHPNEIARRVADCRLMIAMRLHALIFAASQGVVCVAVNYDPKVEALAKIIDAPLLQNLSEAELSRLAEAVAGAQPVSRERRQELAKAAQKPAERVATLA